VVGTQVGFDEEIDYNYLKLDSGKPNGSSGINGINPDYLPRDPKNGCARSTLTVSFAPTPSSTW